VRVKGEGPLPSEVMFVGEGPGTMESQTGRPFVETAPAGAILTSYMGYQGIPERQAVYITNLVKEWTTGATKAKSINDAKMQAEIQKDMWELKLEVLCAQPTLVVALGRYAAQWFLGSVDMSTVHGLVFKTWWCRHCGTPFPPFLKPGQDSTDPLCCRDAELHGPYAFRPVYCIPVVHPAAGLHRPELAACTAADMVRVGTFLQADPDTREAMVWTPQPQGTTDAYGDLMISAQYHPIAIDTEGMVDSPWGYSLCQNPKHATVGQFTTTGRVGWLNHLMAYSEVAAYKGVASLGSLPLTFHNAIHDIQVLNTAGVEVLDGTFDDTMVMAYLLGTEPQALKELALRHLGVKQQTFQELAGTYVDQYSAKTGKKLKKQKFVLKELKDIPLEQVVPYAGADAMVTAGVRPILWMRVVADGLATVYRHDIGILAMYARIEQVGLPIDRDHFLEFQRYLKTDLVLRVEKFQKDYGADFNPNSAQQVGKLLFEILGLHSAKKTVTGQYSTEDNVLQALKTAHPVVQELLEYREVDKLKGTFVDAVQEKLGADNRLRFRIMPTRVISGRPAAKDPNVLALPKHTKLAKRFRAGIRAPEGRLLGSWDFNQIELRVLAGDSGSTFLKHAFEGGLDLHVLTGSEIFGLPPDRAFHDDSLHRLPSKTTNFSIIMGTTGYGLSDQLRGLGYTFPQLQGQSFPDIKSLYRAQAEVCQSWVDRIIDKWEIKPYIDKQHWHARTYGWVADFWGRRRYLPLAASSDKKLRQEALRQAQAFGPQAGARGIYKQGVAAWWTQCYRPLHKMGHYIEPLLDIHDDLLLEFQEDLGPVLLPWVTHILQTTVAWPVPLVVNGKVGQSWVDV